MHEPRHGYTTVTVGLAEFLRSNSARWFDPAWVREVTGLDDAQLGAVRRGGDPPTAAERDGGDERPERRDRREKDGGLF